MATTSTCHSTRSSLSSGTDDEEQNIWNPVLGLCCHDQIGQRIEDIFPEEEWRYRVSTRCYGTNKHLLLDSRFTSTIAWSRSSSDILACVCTSRATVGDNVGHFAPDLRGSIFVEQVDLVLQVSHAAPSPLWLSLACSSPRQEALFSS